MRALFHIMFVVPLALIALLSFLLVLAIKATQDMIAFRPIVKIQKARYPLQTSVQASSIAEIGDS